VLRPLLLVLVAVTVLLALVTTAGRVLVAWLPQLESRINLLLAGQAVEITGIEGRWHILNPVVHVQHVSFGGGHARDVTVEVDVMESALHSALIVRHLSAAQVELAPVRDANGHWRLGKGGTGAGAFPIEEFLRYSDGLRFPDIRVHFAASRDSDDSLAPLG